MSTCATHIFRSCLIPIAMLLALGGAGADGQEVLHVYGSEGPSPAMQEAAMAFQDANGVTVEVRSGPVGKWLESAKADADVIFCSAGFMMSDLIRDGGLKIDPDTVAPLYMRPSAILVRPGNPKKIRDFPDLLQPGMRVMVVTGSGQTGLWEDMAGRKGDISTIRDFRKNVVCFAPDSDSAQRAWKERDDIDAWVTWNVWHLPLHDHADLVNVSEEYVVYRQCNVALTERGKAKPSAARFVEFLASDDGAKIFRSWEWIVLPTDPKPLAVTTDIAIVCRVDQDETNDGVGLGLTGTQRLVEGYQAAGIPQHQLHVTTVLHGDAAYWMLKDEPYRRFSRRSGENPNKVVVAELIRQGVSIELCSRTVRENGWSEGDVLPGVVLIADAYPRIADLQLQGYAYLRF